MAEIVRQHPTITARQLADKMRYAQEKSIYYWLDKAGYQGLQQFKSAVLTGEEAKTAKGGTGRARDRVFDKVDWILAVRYVLSGEEQVGSFSEGVSMGVQDISPSPDSYGVLVETNEYAPDVAKGDLLVVDPGASIGQGDLVLYRFNPDAAPVLRRIYGHNPTQLVHPGQKDKVNGLSAHEFRIGLLGRISKLLRSL